MTKSRLFLVRFALVVVVLAYVVIAVRPVNDGVIFAVIAEVESIDALQLGP